MTTLVTAPGAHRVPIVHRLVAIVAVLSMMLGFLTVAPRDVAAQASYRTTSSLNLREGPGTSFAVILTMPGGATVSVTGAAEFGFLPVTYNGTSGWASSSYITSGGGSSDGGTTGGPTGTRYVMDGRLNLRNGPGSSYSVIAVMPNGATVQLTGKIGNGYSQVTWNGTTGWAATQYLGTSGGSTPTPTPTQTPTPTPTNPGSGDVPVGSTVTGNATTTAGLNLRRGPGTTYGVKLTMPSGARVELMGAAQSGFSPVRYNGTTGWASSTYLRTGTTTPPPTTPTTPTHPGSGTVVATKVTSAAVNFRRGPGTTYGVIRVLASGTSVSVNGSAVSGFAPVTISGTQGWVSSQFLTDPGTTPPSGDEEIIAIIYAAADRWGQPRADMLRVARCESNLIPTAVNRSSGASGLFQFMPGTWLTTPNGKRGENIFNAYSSADAAGWMWANGRRREWSCQ